MTGSPPQTPARRTMCGCSVLTMSGVAEVEDVTLTPGTMLYLGCERRDLRLRTDLAARLLLLGGEPFAEQIVMWWNFVARTGEEIADARREWMTGRRFGPVVGYDGPPLPAPALPDLPLKPGGSSRE